MAFSLVVPTPSRSETAFAVKASSTPKFIDFNDAEDFDILDAEKDFCRITDLSTPISQQRTMQRKHQVVNDIYKNTDILPDFKAANKRGDKVILSTQFIAKITSDKDDTYVRYLPMYVSTSIMVPQNELITNQVIEQAVMDNLVQFYKKNGNDFTPNFNSLLRGAVVPQ